MTWLAPKLRDRIQVLQPIQSPNNTGGYDRSYRLITTIWAQFKPVGRPGILTQTGSRYIRGVQVSERNTHEFVIRRSAIQHIGGGFDVGFSNDFDIIHDFGLPKVEWFIFVEKESTAQGSLFRVLSVLNVDERNEYLSVGAEEIEEQGTGWGDD